MSKENDDLIQQSLRSTEETLSSEAAAAVEDLLADKGQQQVPPATRVPPPVVPMKASTSPDPAKPETQKVAADTVGKPMSNADLAEMLKNLPADQMEEFTRRVAAETRRQTAAEATTKSKAPGPKYVTDFSNVQEKDIFDLRVQIEAISHEIPEFLTVKLNDANYSPRWIQVNSRRMGQAHAEGWQYVIKEDLAEDLKVEVAGDASGHYIYADVVLMKIQKAKLYSRIRANFLRSLAVTKSQTAIHEAMKKVIEQDLQNSEYGADFGKYRQSGAMNTYSPLVGA
ncbi:MAG TPA: hypothetical protein VGF75_00295 [Candidatus Saccharimonadales bacterium]